MAYQPNIRVWPLIVVCLVATPVHAQRAIDNWQRIDERGRIADLTLPPGTDGVMVRATLALSPPQAVTLSLHDTQSGDPCGYWSNRVAIDGPEPIAALLHVPARGRAVRLFAGALDRSSAATIRDVRWTPVRSIVRHRSVQFGSAIQQDRRVGQTFTAAGARLAGIFTRVRYMERPGVAETEGDAELFPVEGDAAAPLDLRVRLYAWADHPATTRDGDVLAEMLIPGRRWRDTQVGMDREMMIPLIAPLEPGKRYMIDFSTNAPGRIALWAGPDQYDGGTLYENNRDVEWDLFMTIYESVEP